MSVNHREHGRFVCWYLPGAYRIEREANLAFVHGGDGPADSTRSIIDSSNSLGL